MAHEWTLQEKFDLLEGSLDERSRRLVAAAEAVAIGWGGIAAVHRASGIAVSTIRRGMAELRSKEQLEPGRTRRPGGGRKLKTVEDPTLVRDLDRLVDPTSRGDPESPLRWTIKSLRRLAEELSKSGHPVSHAHVGKLLKEMDYSLQANRKVKEGGKHPDRNAQFEFINARVKALLRARRPVISVDAKKKENVGDFKNAGREWGPKGKPVDVRVYDFVDPELGKAIPYGVYDIARNFGWVTIGIDHDTAEFAVSSIGRWWREYGLPAYPKARRLLIVADGGGSNGHRIRLWKWELQKLAAETGLTIGVSHLPPGTSKWNKIEHRLFSFITRNWRGKPLLDLATIVKLISNTTTSTGLEVHAYVDTAKYATKIRVTDDQMKKINIEREEFHGE